VYEVNFDTEKLIDQSRIRLDADLHISERRYEIKTGVMGEISKADLKDGTAISVTKTDSKKLTADLYTEVAYDFVGEIEALTNLKRSTVAQILQKIKPNTFLLLRKNPEEFIAKAAKLINETKASLIINNIAYHKTEEAFDAKTVFTNTPNILRSNEILAKHIYDYLETDSQVEREFTRNLEQATEVIVYAKLPKSFYIATPVANYSPDWAIVLDNEKVKHIYFVAETKGSDNPNDLRDIEKLKIHCAKEHFKSISNGEVKFDVISNYSKLLEIAELK
jgi:type III restriction enzyme